MCIIAGGNRRRRISWTRRNRRRKTSGSSRSIVGRNRWICSSRSDRKSSTTRSSRCSRRRFRGSRVSPSKCRRPVRNSLSKRYEVVISSHRSYDRHKKNENQNCPLHHFPQKPRRKQKKIDLYLHVLIFFFTVSKLRFSK